MGQGVGDLNGLFYISKKPSPDIPIALFLEQKLQSLIYQKWCGVVRMGLYPE